MSKVFLSFLVATGLYALQEMDCNIVSIKRSKVHGNEVYATHTGMVDSSNWSGYVAGEDLNTAVNGTVDYAAGYWIVPALDPTSDDTYSAIWVGIDGFDNGTVEQIGTAHEWIDGAPQHFAWFEMYPRGAFLIEGFPVNVGDAISVRVGYKGNGVFKMDINNWTQGMTFTIPTDFTTNTSALRSTAEWIVEAPFSSGILPLADFKLVTFNYCSAIINGVHNTINGGEEWQNNVIVMENNPFYVKSVPTSLSKNGTCFQVQWGNQ